MPTPRNAEEKVPETLTAENLENLETCRMEYEKKYNYFVRGSIIPFLATWYEQGKRNKKFFFLTWKIAIKRKVA